MGNAFEAVADDMNAFEFNPAGLANYSRLKIDIVPAQVRVTDDLATEAAELTDLLDEIDALVNASDPEDLLNSDAASLLVARIRRIQRENLRVHANVGVASVGIPLPAEVMGARLVVGASVSNQLLVGFRFQRRGLSWGSAVLDLLDDEIVAQSALEVVTLRFAGAAEKSLSLPFVEKARAGLSYRVVQRRYREDRFALTDLLDPEGFKDAHFNTTVEDGDVDSFSDVQEILDNNTTKQAGVSVDAGFQVEHTDSLTTALVLRNLVSGLGDAKFPATRTLSVAYRTLDNALVRLLVAASLTNAAGDDHLVDFRIGGNDRIHLGAEAVLFPRIPVRIVARVGNNQGFGTMGLDVRFLFIEASVVRYGDLEADWWGGSVRFAF
jgi:hypothetical protein